MRLRRRPKAEEENITEVVVTETDQVVLNMSGAAERLRALDTEMLSTFIEWRAAQSRCREKGLLVEIEMAEPMRAAYQTWLAEQYRDDSEVSEAKTGVIHSAERGAGDPHGHVHGWPMRLMVPGTVTAW
jgi:hypothetical protein